MQKITLNSFYVSQVFLKKKRGGRWWITGITEKGDWGTKKLLIIIQGRYIFVQIFHLCQAGISLL